PKAGNGADLKLEISVPLGERKRAFKRRQTFLDRAAIEEPEPAKGSLQPELLALAGRTLVAKRQCRPNPLYPFPRKREVPEKLDRGEREPSSEAPVARGREAPGESCPDVVENVPIEVDPRRFRRKRPVPLDILEYAAMVVGVAARDFAE